MDKLIILQELRKLKPILQQKYGLSEIALFGSYSRDEQTRESDIDIMVDFSSPIGIEYFNLVYTLNDAFKNWKVQVVSKKGIKQKYFDRLKQDLLYA
ncbi:MAG: nucleotidyltransferase family protein [Chitinophagaceae bacterium]